MLISVIIPTCNRNDMLSKCLDLLHPSVQTITDVYEVIITDDSANNMAKNLIEENYNWATWVAGPQRGPSANRNNGARKAKGEWLVFIDDDCLAESKLLSEYQIGINMFSNSLAFEGAILPDNWTLLKKDMAECPINTKGDCFWSANISINKTLFERIGGFDEDYLIAAQEDQDIFKRLKETTKVVFLKECIVVHPVRYGSLLKKLSLIKIALKNWYLFAKKNKSFSRCLIEGIKSQIMALITNIRAMKIKSTLYHICVIIVFFPLMISFKIIKK